MGLNFSNISKQVKFKTDQDYYDHVDKYYPQYRISLDIEPNDNKPSVPFIMPVRLPNEIIFVNNPVEHSDLNNLSNYFHEGGHGLYFVNIDENLSTAEKSMGSSAVSEAYAFLFQGLTGNKHWLTSVAGLPEEKADLLVMRNALDIFNNFATRKYLIDLEAEISKDGVNTDNYKKFSDKIVKNSRKNVGFDPMVERWGRYIEFMTRSDDYVAGIILEAQLEEYMRKHFNSKKDNDDKPEVNNVGHGDWYKSRKAGAFLKELWKKGNLTPEELSRELGYKPYDTGPLMRYFDRILGSSVSMLPENFYREGQNISVKCRVN
jgi:hypothetical protein